MNTIFLMLLMVAVLSTAMTARVSFGSKLLRRQYDQHRASWETSDRPTGYGFVPPEASSLWSRVAFTFCSINWLFANPDWIADDPRARRFLWGFRLATIVQGAAIIALIAVAWHSIDALRP